jgi:hypothetical protein
VSEVLNRKAEVTLRFCLLKNFVHRAFFHVTFLELGLHTKLERLPLICKVAINSFEMVTGAMTRLLM